jgi:DNA adenine methylase
MLAMITQLCPMTTPRPFIKWAGGKSQLIQQYLPYFPDRYQNYYEPFVGGGAIFFHLRPSRSLLIDINIELVNVYRCVRDQVEDLILHLEAHREKHCSEYYYGVRAATQIPQGSQQLPADDNWIAEGNNLERAARLIYLNKTCFNGLYRENSKGHFNVPLGSYKQPSIYDPEILRACSTALKPTKIELGSFDIVLDHAKSKADFVYFDPPYHPISATSNFTSYNRYSFHEADQIRLRDTVKVLSDRGVQVMLSNSDCEFVRDLYKEFNIETIYATRNINSNPEKRGKITEVLVTNY